MQLKNENHELMSAVQELLENNQALIRKISKLGDIGKIYVCSEMYYIIIQY